MSRDDIIRIAKEAGFNVLNDGFRDDGSRSDYLDCWPEQLEAFAALVAAHEREECAKVCDQIEDHNWKLYKNGLSGTRSNPHIEGISDGAGYCATAIRARGTT